MAAIRPLKDQIPEAIKLAREIGLTTKDKIVGFVLREQQLGFYSNVMLRLERLSPYLTLEATAQLRACH